MNPIAMAARGKGMRGMFRRAAALGSRYGLTPDKMDGLLMQFANALAEFGCSATFPITSIVVLRNKGVIEKYQSKNIEFAVHGYYHIDQSKLSFDAQLQQFTRARELFRSLGIGCSGFRSPYLRSNPDTLKAIREAGFDYDSSQALVWDVEGDLATDDYRQVLGFYDSAPASDFPALPRWDDGLTRIPYCLPDDEALIDRFQLDDPEAMASVWQRLVAATHARGELCTLGLHPERIGLCGAALSAALRYARTLAPAVWFARLDEIMRWWSERLETQVTVTAHQNDEFHVAIQGPKATTLLARSVVLLMASTPWSGAYRRVEGNMLAVRSPRRPFIGVSPDSAPYLTSFLKQQGYLVEITEDPQAHSFFLNRPRFAYADERRLLDTIEQGTFPLVRLGRWPHAAQSALCITGDIDALTLWDYGMRLFGS